jgi:predicted GIY-YIG superfamily endonuclease
VYIVKSVNEPHEYYVGVTSDPIARLHAHNSGLSPHGRASAGYASGQCASAAQRRKKEVDVEPRLRDRTWPHRKALAIAKLHGLDEPLIMEVLKSVVRKIEIAFRDDPERADDGKRTAVFAVQLVDSIAVNDQLALIRAHQGFPRIGLVPVARVVHAWPFLAAIARVAFA